MLIIITVIMYKKKKILCVITARSGSKGLKNKNILKLGNKPLVYWPLKAAKMSKLIDDIYLSTDSNKIMNVAKQLKLPIRPLRTSLLSKDTTSSVDVVISVIDLLKKENIFFDYIILLEPTSPFTSSKDIDESIKKIINNKKANALVTITENIISHPVFNFKLLKNNFLNSYNTKPYSPIRRQDLNKLYYIEGSIYISKIASLYKTKNFCNNRTIGMIMPKYKSIEIDDYIDLLFARTIYKNLNKILSNEK